jgi:uncharacterized protein (TIGR00251 family)
MITVRPGAQRTQIIGDFNSRLKIKISAPPQDGEANDELIELLANKLSIPKKKIHLVQGETSTEKVVLIELSMEKIVTCLSGLGPC